MTYELLEEPETWVLRLDGEELARFDDQAEALAEAARRMGETRGLAPVHRFAVRFLARG